MKSTKFSEFIRNGTPKDKEAVFGKVIDDACKKQREIISKDTNMSEKVIEKEIQDKDLNAPRLTPALIDAAIVKEQFHIFEDSCLTVCCLTLQNGFTVTGESACASPSNFDAEIGQKIARDNARNKIWMLEGYLLKQRLNEGYYSEPSKAV